VTLSKVIKAQSKRNLHLGGSHTVHLLPHATAQLSPAQSCYCISSPSSATAQPVLLPIVLNNTSPSQLTYTLSPLPGHAFEPKRITVMAKNLVRPSRPRHLAGSGQMIDDELPAWLSGVVQPSASPTLRHQLPGAPADPNELSATQSVVYLPITQTGVVHLVGMLDDDSRPVRIRRTKENEGLKVVGCPEAGFATVQTQVHTCLVPGGVPETRPLDLQVRGFEPLELKWAVTTGSGLALQTEPDKLAGIRNGEGPHEEPIPLPVNATLASPGTQIFTLESVKDGCGNLVNFLVDRVPKKGLLPGATSSREFTVHPPPAVMFGGACGRGQGISLLVGGKSSIEVKLTNIQGELAQRTAARQQSRQRGDEKYTVGWKWTGLGGQTEHHKLTTASANDFLEVDKAGEYEITSVEGKYCEGLVNSPSACSVVVQPPPTIDATFDPLYDVCHSEVGLTAAVHLSGLPPFKLHYIRTQTSPHRQSSSHSIPLSSTREEFTLRPPGPGEWEYAFTRLEDGRYKGSQAIALNSTAPGMRRSQTVQLVAEAKWTERHRTVRSCEGDSIEVELELKGNGPFEVKYNIVGQPTRTLHNILGLRHKVTVDIPPHVSHFDLALESIKDGLECTRPVAAPDLAVDVKRTRPSARFHGTQADRQRVLRDDEPALVPLRLVGESPWRVKYLPPALPGKQAKPVENFVSSANAELKLPNPRPGTYKLLDVSDAYCPGEVSETEFTVSVLPRPTLRLADDALGTIGRDGVLVRRGVCEGTPDSVHVQFEGKAPFKAPYSVRKAAGEPRHDKVLSSSLQPTAELVLDTSTEGKHAYALTGVADANYQTPVVQGLLSAGGAKAKVLKLEQQVFGTPNVEFKQGAKGSFCLHDSLASRSSDELVLRLDGKAPWKVGLEVKQPGHPKPTKFEVDVPTKEWHLKLPFSLDQAVRHDITLLSVTDANGCSRVLDTLAPTAGATASLTVAEVATIAAVSPARDYCVGEFLDFEVKGMAPFVVSTDFRGKKHTVPIPAGHHFRRLADAPGVFRVTGVGSGTGERQCRSTEVEIERVVHALPAARVGEGDSVIHDIHEGDQTEIRFSFEGEPPFTFTYNRRRPVDRFKDRTVLESHTVAGIQDNTYSIFTSQEGTWDVSYVADKWCAFPERNAKVERKAIKAV